MATPKIRREQVAGMNIHYVNYSLGPNERIPVQDIVDAVKVYALAIYYLLGTE